MNQSGNTSKGIKDKLQRIASNLNRLLFPFAIAFGIWVLSAVAILIFFDAWLKATFLFALVFLFVVMFVYVELFRNEKKGGSHEQLSET